MKAPQDHRVSLEEESLHIVRRFFWEQSRDRVYKQMIELVERPLIEMVLQETRGNQKLAAQRLGINRNTLHSRIKKLQIDVARYTAA